MEEKEFQNFLKEKKIDDKSISNYIEKLYSFENFLKRNNKTLETINPEKLIEYSDYLASTDKESVLDFLRAIINYANYLKNYDSIVTVIDISESYNAMDTLYSRIAEVHGEDIRNEIFKDLAIPILGVDPEKKPTFTKTILKRVEEKLGEENTINLLSPCLHGRPPDDIEGDKKKLKELGIDAFLEFKHRNLVERLKKHSDDGTLEFAQYVDDEVIEYVKKDQMLGEGIREGNIIYVKKLPYQAKAFLNAREENIKRFYICYCPWVRGAMKDKTEDESLRNFCHCSAGWYKLYWDQIFEHSIIAKPVNTALDGALECKIALNLPEEVLKAYIK